MAPLPAVAAVGARQLLRLDGIGVEIRDTNRAGSAILALAVAGEPPAGTLIHADGRVWRLGPTGNGRGVEPLDLSNTCEWVVGYTVGATGTRRATWWRGDC